MLEIKDFKEKTGSIFKVKLEDGSVFDLKLHSIDPINNKTGFEKGRKEPFSLIFTSSEKAHLPDNSYVFSAEGWKEEHMIFISAYKSEDGLIYYDSVFN